MLRAVDAAASQHAGEHRPTGEHVQRQVAIAVVMGVKLGTLLIPVQRDVRGIDVQNHFPWRQGMRGDVLLDQDAVQGHHIGSGRSCLEPRERRAAAQLARRAHRRLHQRIEAKARVIVQILVAAAQPVEALRDQRLKRVRDPFRIARIVQNAGNRCRQADLPIHLAQQHQAAVGTERAALEIRLDDTTPETPEIDLVRGTLWHRRDTS